MKLSVAVGLETIFFECTFSVYVRQVRGMYCVCFHGGRMLDVNEVTDCKFAMMLVLFWELGRRELCLYYFWEHLHRGFPFFWDLSLFEAILYNSAFE